MLKRTDSSFYGCLLSTVFAEGFKEKSIVSHNVNWENSKGLYELYDYYLGLFEKNLGVSEFPEGINTNPYDVDVNPTAANVVSQMNLALTILIFSLRKVFSFLQGIKDIDINTKVYEKLTIDSNGDKVGIELIDNTFIQNIVEDLFDSSTKRIAVGLVDSKGEPIPSDVILGSDDAGDFSESSVKALMLVNVSSIVNYIETIYTYNNYEFNGSVSESVVNMHIALDAIKSVINRDSILTKEGFILPGSTGSEINETDLFELIDDEKDLLDSSGNYSFTSYIAKESREINLSGFVGIGPKTKWKVRFEYLSGAELRTQNFYTNEQGFLSEITLLISDTVGAIRVVAEVEANSDAKDGLTGINSRDGDKITGIVYIKANDTSKFFVISPLSTIFSSFALDSSNLDSEEFGYDALSQKFLEKVGLSGYGIEDMFNINPYEASLNPNLTNKLIEINLLFQVLKKSLSVCLKDTNEYVGLEEFVEPQVEHSIYDVIDEIDFSGNIIDLKEQGFIGKIIESFLIRNSKEVKDYQEIKTKVSNFVSFIESNNTYDTTGGDVESSSFALHSAFEALEDNGYSSLPSSRASDDGYVYPIILQRGNVSNFIEFNTSGKFSSGPKVNWEVNFEYLSGISIETNDLSENQLTTDENGNVTDVTINIIDNTQCVKVNAKAVEGSYDYILGSENPDKIGSKLSTILIPSDDDDTPFYASLLSTIFVSSIKNLKIIDKPSLLELKLEYEKKLGIDPDSGFEDGMNTNPYDATLISGKSNKISSITLSLSTLVLTLEALFNDNSITVSVLNSIYEKIINHGLETDTVDTSHFDSDFVSEIIDNISTNHPTINSEDYKPYSEKIANCVSLIEEFNLYNSTGDLASGILNMHSAINAMSSLTFTDFSGNVINSLKNDIITDTNTYIFPYFFPEFDVSEEITVNISGSFGIGPKVTWLVKFYYLSGELINSTETETDLSGNITNIELKLHPNTKIYKVIGTCVLGSSDKLTGGTLSTEATPILSTVLTINETSFYASQISTLFVNSINSELVLDQDRYNYLKEAYEKKLGLDASGGFENGMNTNPFDVTISGSVANKFSVIEISLSALYVGLDKMFTNNDGTSVISKSEIDNFVYQEIIKSAIPLDITNLSSDVFIQEIINNLVETNPLLSSDSNQNATNVSTIVSLIDTYNVYSTSGGDIKLSIQSMKSALESILKAYDIDDNGDLVEASPSFEQEQETSFNNIETIPYPYSEPDPEDLNVNSFTVEIKKGIFTSGPKAFWQFSFSYLSNLNIKHNHSGSSPYTAQSTGLTSDEDGSIRDISFDIVSSQQEQKEVLYKAKAVARLSTSPADVNDSFDILTTRMSIVADENDVITYEELPIIAILTADMTDFYATIITTIFATSIKDIDVLSYEIYTDLKEAYEVKLGIDTAPAGMNTNPYDVTVSPDIANKLSVLSLTLEVLVLGINTLFKLNDNTKNVVTTDEILNSVYENITNFSGSISVEYFSLESTINNIIENIVEQNPHITNSDAVVTDLKKGSLGISSCVSYIERFSTFSNNGNITESILAMHKSLVAITILLTESTDKNDFTDVQEIQYLQIISLFHILYPK